jgi:hypothetical protein
MLANFPAYYPAASVTKPQKSFIALTPRREGVGPLERLVVVVVVAVGNEEAGEQSTQVRIRKKRRKDLGPML